MISYSIEKGVINFFGNWLGSMLGFKVISRKDRDIKDWRFVLEVLELVSIVWVIMKYGFG